MFEVKEEPKEEINREIEEIISRIESLSLTPAPMLQLVVSEWVYLAVTEDFASS